MGIKELKMSYHLLSKEEIHNAFLTIDVNERTPYQANTLLHMAAGFLDSDGIKTLLSRGFDVNIENDNSDRPLHSLVLRDRDYNDEEELVKCVRLLLDAGASVLKKNIDGKTPVILAAENGDYLTIKEFVDRGLKITLKDSEGNNALHSVCYNFSSRFSEKYLNIAKLLVDSGFDVDEKNANGDSALDLAARSGSSDLLSILKGNSCEGVSFSKILEERDLNMFRKWLEEGHELNSVIEESGAFKDKTLLGAACYFLDKNIVEMLLEAGANPNYKNSDGINSIGEMLGYLADMNFEFGKEKDVADILNLLVANGLDINDSIDNDSNTALIKACMYIDKNQSVNGKTLSGIIAKKLLNLKCDLNKANLMGQTALMMICRTKRSEASDIQTIMLEHDVEINSIDKQGNTPLIYAAMNENQSLANEMVEMLFEFGEPKLDFANNLGKTALDIATENNNEQLVNVLLAKM